MSDKFRATPGSAARPNGEVQAGPWEFDGEPAPTRDKKAGMPIWPWLLGGGVLLFLLIVFGGVTLLFIGFRTARQAQMQARMAAVEAETYQAREATSKVKEDLAKERAKVSRLTSDLDDTLRRVEQAGDPDRRLRPGAIPPIEPTRLPPEVLAQRWQYIIVVERVDVKPAKADGRPWDGLAPYEAPDPYVAITRDDPVRQRLHADLTAEIARLQEPEKLRQQQVNYEQQLQKTAADSPQRTRLLQSLQQVKDAGARPLTNDELARIAELQKQAATLYRQFHFATPVVQDVTSAKYNVGDLGVNIGDEVTLRVLDKDVIVDDIIGTTKLKITQQLVNDGEIGIAFGQVNELRLRVEKAK